MTVGKKLKMPVAMGRPTNVKSLLAVTKISISGEAKIDERTRSLTRYL